MMICEETYAADTPGRRGLSACGGGGCVLQLKEVGGKKQQHSTIGDTKKWVRNDSFVVGYLLLLGPLVFCLLSS